MVTKNILLETWKCNEFTSPHSLSRKFQRYSNVTHASLLQWNVDLLLPSIVTLNFAQMTLITKIKLWKRRALTIELTKAEIGKCAADSKLFCYKAKPNL